MIVRVITVLLEKMRIVLRREENEESDKLCLFQQLRLLELICFLLLFLQTSFGTDSSRNGLLSNH